ncbi:PPOX class F420-dependent oxidoreductase [Microbacteriaceae bacterium VKM Ac-2855]|nr:PPOX class F420-dependent oxidoreductase [Microbacteriaceae bacterium VKM Ac-2855]
MPIDVIPEKYRPLLDEAVIAALGTVRPDNTAQVNPMWFYYDAESQTLRFTHTTKRAKYRNLQKNPSMSLAIVDPADRYSYVEIRGELVETIPDPTGAFYVFLQNRYGNPSDVPPPDSADRVSLVMSMTHSTQQ